MANLKPENHEIIRSRIFDRIHHTGELVKTDFPNLLRAAIEGETWKHFKDSEGKPFKGLVAWLHSPWPNGPGMGYGSSAINFEDAVALTASAPKVNRLLKSQKSQAVSNPDAASAPPKTKDNRDLLSARLEREAPEYHQRYLNGEFASTTAAAIAAGIIKDNQNLHRAKSAFRKMTSEQRNDFLGWLKERKSKSDS